MDDASPRPGAGTRGEDVANGPAWARGLQAQLRAVEGKLDDLLRRVEHTLTSSTTAGDLRLAALDVDELEGGICATAPGEVVKEAQTETMSHCSSEVSRFAWARPSKVGAGLGGDPLPAMSQPQAEPEQPCPAEEQARRESRPARRESRPWRGVQLSQTVQRYARGTVPGRNWWKRTVFSGPLGVKNRDSRVFEFMDRVQAWLLKSYENKMKRGPQELLWRLSGSTGMHALSAAAITLNVACVGLRADDTLDAQLYGRKISPAWWYVEAGFCSYFTIELLVRLLAEEVVFFLGPAWRWNAFDSAIVFFTLLDIALESSSLDSSLPAAWSVLRCVRIARIARALRAFHKLRVVVYAIYASIANLMWCFVVIGVIIYVFAVLFVTGVSDRVADLPAGKSSELVASYGTTLRASQSLFMAVSGGTDWGDSMEPLAQLHSIYEITFTCYIFFMVIGVLNVVVGAFVATTGDIVARDRDFMIRAETERLRSLEAQMRTCLDEADAEGSGGLNREEFLTHMERKEVAAYFHALGLDPADSWKLFGLLDQDGDGRVDLDEILQGCIRLRGQAKSVDVHLLLSQNRQLAKEMAELLHGPGTSRPANRACEGDGGGAPHVWRLHAPPDVPACRPAERSGFNPGGAADAHKHRHGGPRGSSLTSGVPRRVAPEAPGPGG